VSDYKVIILTKQHRLWEDFSKMHADAIQEPLLVITGSISSCDDSDHYGAAFALLEDKNIVGFQRLSFDHSLQVASTQGLYLDPEYRGEKLSVKLQASSFLLAYHRYHMRVFYGSCSGKSIGKYVLQKTFDCDSFNHEKYLPEDDLLVWHRQLRVEPQQILSRWEEYASAL
jgi:hypothetical protein